MINPFGIDDAKFIELRLKCLEPFITIASKHSIENDVVLMKAEKAWNDFVVKPLVDEMAKTPPIPEPEPIQPGAPTAKSRSKK